MLALELGPQGFHDTALTALKHLTGALPRLGEVEIIGMGVDGQRLLFW